MWTDVEFEQGSLELIRALQEERPDDSLVWTFEKGCLEARISRRRVPTVRSERSHEAVDSADDDDSEYDELDDASIWMDSDAAPIIHPETDSPHYRDWYLSVVCSPVWNVPVLYFTVQCSDTGRPCTRHDVLAERQSSHGMPFRDDMWEFCSYELHPVTGVPGLMVHPCRTRDCLNQMRTLDDSNVAHALWSWLAMTVPSIGLTVISPHTFRRVATRLSRTSK